MRTDISIGLFDLIIFLGVFQGIFLYWFFIKNSKDSNKANLFNGLLLLFLSLTMFEELLNNTGYIVQLLVISDFSEPLNFTFAPLLYLYVSKCLYPEKKKTVGSHFIISFFWVFYMIFHFIQPDELKYNNYVQTKHPDWEYLEVIKAIPDDPIGVRKYINQLTLTQIVIYLPFVLKVIFDKAKQLGESILKPSHEMLLILRNTIIHFLIIIIIYFGTKLYYGMNSDIGSYLIASYVSLMIFATSYQVVIRSDFFSKPQSFFNFPVVKYQKSSLNNNHKQIILEKVKNEMQVQKYFTHNLCSLSRLAKKIGEPSHHVSQVINEKLGKSFFELVAEYRVEEAKRIMQAESDIKITIEELTEKVGYNSKSSFNTTFKKLTGQTPSEFRKGLKER